MANVPTDQSISGWDFIDICDIKEENEWVFSYRLKCLEITLQDLGSVTKLIQLLHTKTHILNTKQYGLGIGLRTDNVIYKITPGILNAINKVRLVWRNFCDLKFFNCVDNGILLSARTFCGINWKDHEFF